MGIIAFCPNGHRIKVKDDLAGRKGICPTCEARFRIPRKGAAPERSTGAVPAGPPTARVVSLDPLFAASLPVATALDDAETVFAAGAPADPADAAPDFVLVEDEPQPGDVAVDVPARVDEGAGDGPAMNHSLLDERPDLCWCFAARGGDPSAALDAAAMRAWLESGAATADHVVWRQDWPDWRPVQDAFPGIVPPATEGWP